MRSTFFFRLIVLLLLAIAAGVVIFGMRDESGSSLSIPATTREARPGAETRSAVGAEPPAIGEPQVNAAPAPGPSTTGGETPDHVGRLAPVMAAAERSGALNPPGARTVTSEQAQAVLQKLAQEQAHKDAVPLTSPFGNGKPSQAGSGDAPAARAAGK